MNTPVKPAVKPAPFVQVDLKVVIEKKNTMRFDFSADRNVSQGANVQNLYVKKSALANAFGNFAPNGVRITIEAL